MALSKKPLSADIPLVTAAAAPPAVQRYLTPCSEDGDDMDAGEVFQGCKDIIENKLPKDPDELRRHLRALGNFGEGDVSLAMERYIEAADSYGVLAREYASLKPGPVEALGGRDPIEVARILGSTAEDDEQYMRHIARTFNVVLQRYGALMRENGDLKRERDDLKRERDRLQTERNNLKAEHDRVARECNEHKRERNNLETMRDALAGERHELQVRLQCVRNGYNCQREQNVAEREKFVAERKQVAAERDLLERELEELEEEHDEVKRHRDQLVSETCTHSELKADNDRLQRLSDALLDDCAKMRRERDAANAKLSKTVASLARLGKDMERGAKLLKRKAHSLEVDRDGDSGSEAGSSVAEDNVYNDDDGGSSGTPSLPDIKPVAERDAPAHDLQKWAVDVAAAGAGRKAGPCSETAPPAKRRRRG